MGGPVRGHMSHSPDLLAALPASLRQLAARGEVRRYRKGTLLIQEGEHGDTLYIILSGRLRAFASGDKGRELTFGTYGAGEYIGEMSLDGGPRSASVITLEATECAIVTRQVLLQYIAENPEFAFELIAKLIRRARAATLSAKQLALNDVYGRLARLLQDLAVPGQDGVRIIAERLTHREIASRVGCSREMVSRVMKDLEGGGYLSAAKRWLVLHRALPARW
jgi:CRP/FNR family transcriptional regulator, cyclic AMP receptor protein